MISYLEGTVKFKEANYLIVVTHGVGYKVFVPAAIISQSLLDTELVIHTYTYVKEDALDLYGFSSMADLQLYELLLSVSGIGPKTALGIFSAGKPEQIKQAIIKGDIDFFTTVPRLGKKNAQKIIIELRSKLGSLEILSLEEDGGADLQEVIDALKGFGFSVAEAREALRSLPDERTDVSEKIRLALKFLGKGK